MLGLLLTLSFVDVIHAENSWQELGTNGLSDKQANYISLRLDGNNVPYVSYQDSETNKVFVKKWNGVSWDTLGSDGASPSYAYYNSIAFDSHNTPYIVYEDSANNFGATVRKWNGSSWEAVGIEGFSVASAGYESLAFDGHDVPYVSFSDNAAGNYVTVMTWNGTSWVNVGNQGFSDGSADYISLAIDHNNMPYVAYRDNANGYGATVKKWDGANWQTVGSSDFSPGQVYDLSFTIDHNNVPYVAFEDQGNNYQATVMKWNGTSWSTVGSPAFSPGQAYQTSLAVDSHNNVYIAFADSSSSGNAMVMKWDGNSWSIVGESALSTGNAINESLALSSDDVPYVAYRDNVVSSKAIVKFFTDLSVYQSNEDLGTPTPNSPGTLSTYANYVKTMVKDSTYWITNLSGTEGGYDSQVYKIHKDLTGIQNPKYTVNWSGHGDAGSDKNVNLFIWNTLSSGWDQLAQQHCSSDCDLTSNATGTKYNDGQGNVWLWAKAEHAASPIEIIDGSVQLNSNTQRITWKTNVPGTTEVVYDDIPHSSWDDFINNGSGNMGHLINSDAVDVAPVGGFTGTYYNNETLTGAVALSRNDAVIDYDWGTGSPDPAVNVDNFSAHWDGTITAPANGDFTFYMSSDDGSRLILDSTVVIDQWGNCCSTWSYTKTLTKGQVVNVGMDFHEIGGGASARLTWSGPGLSGTTSHVQHVNFYSSNFYFMVRSADADGNVVTSQLQGPLLSSCPFIFTWDGSKYNFVIDASPSAGLSAGLDRDLWKATPFYKDPNTNNNYADPLSFTKIAPNTLAPRTNGGETYYDIKTSTELNETNYYDQAALQVPMWMCIRITETTDRFIRSVKPHSHRSLLSIKMGMTSPR